MALIFDVKVVPSAGKSGCFVDKNGRLKCLVKKPAEKGLANKELIKLFAKAVRTTQDRVQIVFGATSRNKRISIDVELTFEQLLAMLGIERQQSLLRIG